MVDFNVSSISSRFFGICCVRVFSPPWPPGDDAADSHHEPSAPRDTCAAHRVDTCVNIEGIFRQVPRLAQQAEYGFSESL
jgi:hypothetical protein